MSDKDKYQQVADLLNEHGVDQGRYGELFINGSRGYWLVMSDEEDAEMGWKVVKEEE